MGLYSTYQPNTANSLQSMTDASQKIRNMARGGLAAQVQQLMQEGGQDADAQVQNNFNSQQAAYQADFQNYTKQWDQWQSQMVPYLQAGDARNNDLTALQKDSSNFATPGVASDRSNAYFFGLPNDTLQAQSDLANQPAPPGLWKLGGQTGTFNPPTAPLGWGNLNPQSADIGKTIPMEELTALSNSQLQQTMLKGFQGGSTANTMNWLQNVRGDKMLSQATDAASQAYGQAANAQNANLAQQQAAYGGVYQNYLDNKQTWQNTLADRQTYDSMVGTDLGAYDKIHNANSVQDAAGNTLSNINFADVNQTNNDISKSQNVEAQGVLNSPLNAYKTYNGQTVTLNRPDIYKPMFSGGDYGKPGTPSYLPSVTSYNPTLSPLADITNTYGGNAYLDKLLDAQDRASRFGQLGQFFGGS